MPLVLVLLTISSARSLSQQRDTVYQMAPVVSVATQGKERETPATFTDLKRADIRERYTFQDVPVMLSELPSMTTYSENGNGVGYNYVSLRGFDQRRISVMINGIPQNDPEDHNVYWIDFPDLLASTDNIQVQRGAGSAFYGPAAIGGSINLITNPFSGEPGITVESSLGFQQFADSSRSFALNTKRISASFRSGLVDGRYMFYGRMGRITSDGYRQNSWVDLQSYFLGAMRVDSSMTTRFHLFGGPLTDGLSYDGLPKSFGGDPVLRRQNLVPDGSPSGGSPRRPQETEYFSQPHAELIHDWNIGKGISLHNTLFYYSGEGYFDYDASWADTTTLRLGSAYGIPATANPGNTLIRGYVANTQWGWLPRIDIDHSSGTLTLGLETRFHRSTHWGKISYAENLPAGLDPDYHMYEYNGTRNIVSLYGSESYHLTDQANLAGSVQVVWNSYGIHNEKFLRNDFTVPYVFVNPRLGLNYNVDERLNAYVSVAYTSREPRMRNLYAAEDSYFGATPQFKADTTGGSVRYDFSQPLAKPERLLDLELGSRYTTPDAQVGVSLFWMEFSDELVKSGQVDIFGQPITGNAGRSRHIGVEVDGMAALPFGLMVSGNVSVSANRLVHYSVLDDNGVLQSFDGNHIAGFPDVLGNLRMTHRAGVLISSFAVKYVGSFYTDNTQHASRKNDSYVVCDLDVTSRFQFASRTALEIRGEVRNIFNRYYFMNGEGDAFFPAAERSVVLGVKLEI
jgi:iron complex outermembrane receptor protein